MRSVFASKTIRESNYTPSKAHTRLKVLLSIDFLFQEILKFNIVKNRSVQGSDSSDAMVHIKRANMIPK